MFNLSKLVLVSGVVGTLASYSNAGFTASDDTIAFQFVGQPDTIAEFLSQYKLRIQQHHVLDKLCDPVLHHPFNDENKLRLIFICDAQEAVFNEMGAVFLAATPPHSPRPAGELTAATSSACPNKKCANANATADPPDKVPDPHSTDCTGAFGICYHRLHAFDHVHICQ
jgi:hypothetical protein